MEDLQDNNTAEGNQAESTTVCTLPFTRLRDQKKIHFPVCLLNNLYVSNGMAAGNSISECRAQAVAEIIERYVKNIIIAKGISLPDVPRKLLQNIHLLHIVDALKEHGFSVKIKDASLGGRFPVICVLLIDPASKGAYAAFGASCRFEVAIERTLTELLQGRNLDALHNFTLPTHDLEQVADPFNLESHFVDSDGLLSWRMFSGKPDYAFTKWDFSGTTEAEYSQLCTFVCQAGFDLHYADYSHFGMYCCRILIPGMSEIYPVDDLIYNNRNRGSWLRSKLLLLPGASDQELTAVLEELEGAGFQDQQKIGEIIGVCFDQNSCWHSLCVGELKTMLHLALGNREDARTWALWCVDHGQLDGSRQNHYRLISSLLGWQLSDTEQREYHSALCLFFSEEEIRIGEDITAGKMKFHNLQFGRTWRQISQSYATLLDLYVKLQACKI